MPTSFLKNIITIEIINKCCPTFISTSPKSFIREFLGGLFGGNGFCPNLKSNKNTFSNVKLSLATNVENKILLENNLKNIIELMKKLDVEAEISKNKEYYEAKQKMVEIYIYVKSNEVFRKNIGFRHYIFKLARLDIACSYERYCEEVKKQYDIIFDKVNSLINKNYKKEQLNIILEKVNYELYSKCKPLNEYYSLLPSVSLVQHKINKFD